MAAQLLYELEELRDIADQLGELRISVDDISAPVLEGAAHRPANARSEAEALYGFLADGAEHGGDLGRPRILVSLEHAVWLARKRGPSSAALAELLSRGEARWPWQVLEGLLGLARERMSNEALQARVEGPLTAVEREVKRRRDEKLNTRLHQVRGRLRWRLGDVQEARRDMIKAWKIAISQGFSPAEAEISIDLGEYHRSQGDPESAARWSIEAIAILGDLRSTAVDAERQVFDGLWDRALLELARADAELGMWGWELIDHRSGQRGEHVEQAQELLELFRSLIEGPTARPGGPPAQTLLIADRFQVVFLGSDPTGRCLVGREVETRDAVWAYLERRESDTAAPTTGIGADPRMAQLPGLPELIEAGVQGPYRYRIWRYVPCSWFPGLPSGRSWSAIEPMISVLIAQMEGLLFNGKAPLSTGLRGLRVTMDGRPLLLGPAMFGNLGHKRYLPPEYAGGTSGTLPPQATHAIYALGVLLRDLLRGPGADGDWEASGEPWRWDVPKHVRVEIERMCAPLASQRPQSIPELRAALRGPNQQPVTGVEIMTRLRWGDQHPTVDALVRRARERRPASVCTAGGALMAAVKARLIATGFKVYEAVPSDEPYGSLAGILGPSMGPGAPEPVAWERALRALLQQDRVVLLAQDDRAGPGLTLDEESRSVISRIVAGDASGAPGGAVLRTVSRHEPQDLEVAPIDLETMQRWFDAPRRVVNVPGRAADWLLTRTDGEPGVVGMELELWERFGFITLAAPSGSQDPGTEERIIEISAEHLDRMQAEIRMSPPAMRRGEVRARLEPPESEVLAWIHVTWPTATEEALIQLLTRVLTRLDPERWSALRPAGGPWTPNHVTRALRHLMQMGLVYENPTGVLVALTPSLRVNGWTTAEMTKAHEVVASLFGSGDPRALRHVLLGRAPSVLKASMAEARRLLAEDRHAEAAEILQRGYTAWTEARKEGAGIQEGPSEALAFLQLWFATVLRKDTGGGLLRLLEELQSYLNTYREATGLAIEAEMLRDLVEAAILVRPSLADPRSQSSRARRALQLLAKTQDHVPPELEYLHLQLHVFAARDADQAEGGTHRHEEAALRRAHEAVQAGRAVPPELPGLAARLKAWEAFARYQQSRPEEAKELLDEAVRMGEGALLWRRATLEWQAAILLDDGDLAGAHHSAQELRAVAMRSHHARSGLVAEVFLRQVAYRAGDRSMEVDEELVSIAELPQVGTTWDKGMVFLSEAAVAWRAGQRERGEHLARKAGDLFSGAARLLARCLEHACGRPWTDASEPVEKLVEPLLKEDVEWYAQGLALLKLGGASIRPDWFEQVREAASHKGARQRSRCWEVMSIDAAIEVLSPST